MNRGLIIIFLFLILNKLGLVCPVFSQMISSVPYGKIKEVKDLEGINIFCVAQDSMGFMWFGGELGLYKYDGNQLIHFKHNPLDQNSINNEVVTAIEVDYLGNIWIGYGTQGLDKINPKTNIVTHYPLDSTISNQLKLFDTFNMLFVNNNELWIQIGGRAILSFDIEKLQYSIVVQTDSTNLNRILRLIGENRKSIWFTAAEKGKKNLSLVRWKEGKLDSYYLGSGYPCNFMIDPNDRLWIVQDKQIGFLDLNTLKYVPKEDSEELIGPTLGIASPNVQPMTHIIYTREMVSAFNEGTKQFDQLFNVPSEYRVDRYFLDHHHFVDKHNNLWIDLGYKIPTYLLGIKDSKFKSINLNSTGRNVLRLGEDELLIASENGFYYYKDNNLRELPEIISKLDLFKDLEIIGLQFDQEGWLVFSTFPTKRFYRFNPQKNLLKEYDIKGGPKLSFVQDSKGIFWIGTWGGLARLDIANDSIKYYKKQTDCKTCLQDESIRTVYLDQNQKLWIGTQNAGLHHFNPETEEFRNYSNRQGDTTSLSSNTVYCIVEDRKKRLWIGTSYGLNLLDIETGNARWFLTEDGLPNQTIEAIVEDEKGYIWIGTDNGISRLNPEISRFDNFELSDQGTNYFYEQAVSKDQSGVLYWGTNNGVLSFDPQKIQDPSWEFPVRLTAFRLNNKLVKGSPNNQILKEDITYSKELKLTHDQNFFSIEYAALYYKAPEILQYAYTLENLDEDWNYVGNKREAVYTNVPPGDYIFRVKAENGKGVWSSKEINLKIIVLPPWYWNIYTKSLYALLFLGFLYGLYHFQLSRKLEQAESRRLRELDQIKTQLYTNITHEFRTPLTIISGMADQIQENPKNWLQQGLEMIKRNSVMLLNLVNQMLDLSKLESGNLAINMVQGDIIGYLKYITESFHSYAATKDIRLHFLSKAESLNMDYDPEKILNIISNLLSNAVKFTLEGGDVYLTVDGPRNTADWQNEPKLLTVEWLSISVRDTGQGIAEDQLPHIFDRFYQVDDTHTRKEGGSGIGLALTKELVKLMKGEIEVKSKVGEGAEFLVVLPITRTKALEENSNISLIKEQVNAFVPVASISTSSEPGITSVANRPLALIIEDNKDVVQYLRACLEKDYQLEVAFDGQEGINKALELIPDIIISDVMMPNKDGFEVSERLKNDTKTSHIPLILLTAKADVESRISGLSRGADAYLAKPFDKKELNVRIEQLITLRKKLQARYSTQAPNQLSSSSQFQLEDVFLQKVHGLIQEQLSDPNFGTEVLAKSLGMSRSQLFRKLKALTGSSIVAYIRLLRLQKAKELLQQAELNVSEIAYEVGFNDPAYFSRSFQEEFGVPPSAMRGSK